jgi:hypothetical protein
MVNNDNHSKNGHKGEIAAFLNFITKLLENAKNRGVFINVALSCLCFVFLGLSRFLSVHDILLNLIQIFSTLGIIYGVSASFWIGQKLGRIRYAPPPNRQRLPSKEKKERLET